MVFMRLSYLILSLFVSFSSATGFGSILYRSELSLTLLKYGASSFIQKSRNESIEDYEYALYDIIDLKNWNNSNIDQLFKNIHDDLDRRIKKINRLQNKTIDPKALIIGLGYIGLGIGLTYATYYTYINYHQANRDKYTEIKQYLENNGVIVEWKNGDLYLTVPPKTSYCKEGKELIELSESSENIRSIECLGSILAPLAYFHGILNIVTAFNPHSDDKYLEKYKDMLAIIIQLHEQYSAQKLI